MKKKLLFVNESLALAGGEKSLIALLSCLNPDLYEIDLQLFRYGGELDGLVPDFVNILPPLPYAEFVSKTWKQQLFSIFKRKNASYLKARLKYSFSLRKGQFNHPEKAQLYWEATQNAIDASSKKYDIAIAYAQVIPTFYVMDKVAAKQKIAGINAKPNFPEKNLQFQLKYYRKYDFIIPVSDITYQQCAALMPELVPKMHILYDIVDYKSILKMADLFLPPFKNSTFNILTVARLNLRSKRYDITLEACKILKEKGRDFHWYALGEGDYRPEMEEYIQKHGLGDCFTLLGTDANPYPYFKAADLYVQTSQYESYGISIAEARMLNLPIVTTKFDTVELQIRDRKNGLITDLDPEKVADAIVTLMDNKELYDSMVYNLKNEEKENQDTIKYFEKLIFEDKVQSEMHGNDNF